MSKDGLKTWVDEIREDREKSPIETFFMLLMLLALAIGVVSVVVLLIYFFPIPIISVIVSIAILWNLYKRL